MRRTLAFQPIALLVAALAAAATLEDVADQWSVEIVTIGRTTGKPRLTTIWFVHEKGAVWVQSGQGGKTSWYRNLVKNPEVTLRFDGLEIAGRATPIEDPEESERVHRLFLDKYWTARISTWFGGGFGTGEVVRIEPVTSARGGAPPAPAAAAAGAASPPEPRPE